MRKKKEEIGKRNKEKGNGEKGKKRKEKEGAGAHQRRPRLLLATRGVRAAGGGARGQRGERKKERGKKRGRDSRRPVTTRRVGWERDGT